MKMRLVHLPVLVACAVAGIAAPASARPPQKFSFTESGTEVLAGCDGFDIILSGTTAVRGQEFFNQSGETVQFVRHGRVRETMTNSVTGKTVVNRGVFTDFFRRIRGTDEFTHTVSGFDFQGKVDGRGPIVFQVVGRKVVVFDPETEEETIVSQVGHNTLGDGADAEAVFCAALS